MHTTDTPTKVCAQCHVPKPITDFAKRTKSRDGLQAHCRDCGRAMLDAADARRRARTQAQHAHVIIDRDDLAERLADHADDVVDALFAAAETGDPDVLYRIADVLCSPESPDCPAGADDYTGAECLPHLLADAHANGGFGAP
jgi:hypothetical protein